MKLEELGEFGLIERIRKSLPKSNDFLGIGDDCAIIPCGGKEFLVSVDTLVEGVHFLKDTDPYLLGRKSLSVNISDVAAMAGVPKWAFLSLSLDKDRDVSWVNLFLKGFLDVAKEFNVFLLGGDTTSSDVLTISITIIGESDKGSSIKRSGAKVGDFVAVTGEIGCSYAGLLALKNGFEGCDELKFAHLNPYPKVREALSIKEYATAIIDISDGLIQDCGHICEESGVGIKLYWERIPFCYADFVSKEEMLCGGEDYELVVCFDRKFKDKMKDLNGFTVIGEVVEGSKVSVLKDGIDVKLNDCGFKHF